MILQSGILALLLGAAIIFALMCYAALLGMTAVVRWDAASSSEGQLLLERRTSLIATIVGLALVFSLFSILLFLYTIEDIHTLFVGAMCATGTLNANPVGWWILLSKGGIFFSASVWMILNNLDQHCEDTPLVRLKFGVLPMLTLLLGVDLVLQLNYFTGLEPEKITSCCGSLFATGGGSVAAELAAFAPAMTMCLFYGAAAVYLLTLVLCLLRRNRLLRVALLVEALVLLPLSLVSVISFISPYIYQMPSHHCPFDMLQKNYYYVGYPFYIGLFAGILFGLIPGLCLLLPKTPGLTREIAAREKGWLWRALLFFSLFLGITTWPVLFGSFRLFAY